MAGLVRRVALRQILPGCPGAKHPEHPVENIPRISPWSAASIQAALRPRQEGFDDRPLFFREIHAHFPAWGGVQGRGVRTPTLHRAAVSRNPLGYLWDGSSPRPGSRHECAGRRSMTSRPLPLAAYFPDECGRAHRAGRRAALGQSSSAGAGLGNTSHRAPLSAPARATEATFMNSSPPVRVLALV
jgi:hypothetical protein